jgi:16S rRNA processing protein RimM
LASPDERKFVTVARILRARGNKGEVAAELLTDFPERLPQIKEMFVGPGGGPRDMALSRVTLQNFWLDRNHPGQCVFHFAGVASIDAAEKLRGLMVQIPFEQRVTLDAGKYFVTDLIGCSVFELPVAEPTEAELTVGSPPCSSRSVPQLLGQVRDVYFPGDEGQAGTPLLAVQTDKEELLVPLAEDICTRVDIAARRIEARLPEGLRDLNG